jgi:hypothetical protein
VDSFYIIGAPLVAGLFGLFFYLRNLSNKRIDVFEKNFFEIYKNDGCVLECLISSGVANLKNDKEIETGLGRLRNRIGFNPLRKWDNDVNKIGYKKFFQRVVIGPGHDHFNKNTIQAFINSFKKNGGTIYEDDEAG